jgi:branched-chain amino acid transport system permease protein
MLQRAFSQDYRAVIGAKAAAAWPPISLFGRAWAPWALLTWAVPALLLATGGGMLLAVRRMLRALGEGEGRDELPVVALSPTTGSVA